MDDIIKRLNRKFREDMFVKKEEDVVDVISTNSLALDISTGVGGIPRGKVTVIYGVEASGKSSLCLELVRTVLLNGGKVAYIDVEHGLYMQYILAVIGKFDTSNLLIVEPDTAEEAMELVETLLQGDKKIGLAGGQFDLIIVDSVAALAPEKEREKDLTDKNVALASSLLSAFFRRNMDSIKRTNTALVMVDQIRAKIGGYGGYDYPGGHALKHYSSMVIMLSTGQKIKFGDKTVGMLCSFIIKKNKVGPPFRQFTFPLMFGKGIDTNRDILEFAKTIGVIKTSGSYYKFEDETLGQGVKKTLEFFNDNPEILDKIKERCYNLINVGEPSDDEEEYE